MSCSGWKKEYATGHSLARKMENLKSFLPFSPKNPVGPHGKMVLPSPLPAVFGCFTKKNRGLRLILVIGT